MGNMGHMEELLTDVKGHLKRHKSISLLDLQQKFDLQEEGALYFMNVLKSRGLVSGAGAKRESLIYEKHRFPVGEWVRKGLGSWMPICFLALLIFAGLIGGLKR